MTIVKTNSGYRLVSGKGKNLGDFGSKEAAEKHEREVQFFKHKAKLNKTLSFGEAIMAMYNANQETL